MTPTPEQAILRTLIDGAERVSVGFAEAQELLGPTPNDPNSFDALNKVQRTAAAALLKRFEQLQDIIARIQRTALLADGVDISAMTARDIANRMEKLRALPDAARWSEIVRLRNRLAHEYPLSVQERFDRLTSVLAAVQDLREIRSAIVRYLDRQGLLD